MQTKNIVLLAAAIIPLLTGCASHPTALAPVGPAENGRVAAGSKGYLQVFTATQKSPPVASDDSWRFDQHTGFDLLDPSGKQIGFVANHRSHMDTSPDEVALKPGSYTIVANSTECGLVSVPVDIQMGKTTVVRLDGH